MAQLANTSQFSSDQRGLLGDDEIVLVSVGVDIGSSTTHLVFSRLTLERDGTRYITVGRKILYQSGIRFTPYRDQSSIDGEALEQFITAEFKQAGLDRTAVDSGALILTGTAVLKENARTIADVFAAEAGRFVAVSAGDGLETTLAAHGSGAVALAAERGETIMNVDVGGGTSKVAICRDGGVEAVCAIEVGARLLALGEDERIERLEDGGRRMLHALGLNLAVGDRPTPEQLRAFVVYMADRLFEVMRVQPLSAAALSLLRTPALSYAGSVQALTFSGGVSEFIYGRESASFGDLGGMLAEEIRSRLNELGIPLLIPTAGIRATVIGASQHTVQLSGNTIFISSHDAVPVRNLPVVAPVLNLDDETLRAETITSAIEQALSRLDLLPLDRAVALALRWGGSASYGRLNLVCAGILDGVRDALKLGYPLVLVTDGDVGGLIGLHLKEEMGVSGPVISIDGVELREFDFVDVGALIHESGAVPVIIKSLVFPAAR